LFDGNILMGRDPVERGDVARCKVVDYVYKIAQKLMEI
jgi:hypothetical protein